MEKNKVLITGLPSEDIISTTDLVMYFQSKKKSGGGEVLRLDRLEEGKAIVTFQNEIVARDVLSAREHKVNGIRIQATVPRSLTRTQASTRAKAESSEGSSSEESSDEETEDPEEKCSICVNNVPPEATEKSIQDYFEKPKKFKGGPVRKVDLNPSTNSAVVVFQCEEDAKRVLDYRKHKFKKVHLEVALLNSNETILPQNEKEKEKKDMNCSQFGPQTLSPLDFTVSGIALLSTEDSLQQYLENTMRSGGGNVTMLQFYRDKDIAEVKFESVKDINRLLCGKHVVEDNEITVKAKTQDEEVLADPLKIQIKGLKPSTSPDCIRFYLEKMSNVEVQHVQPGGCGNALICFVESPDFEELSIKILKDTKGVEGQRVTVERVPYCDCVQVLGLSSNVTEERLKLYFESPSRGCGALPSKVEIQKEQGKALVFFNEPSVISRALDKPHHGIEGEEWKVELFYPFLNKENQLKRKHTKIQEIMEIKVDPDVMAHITKKHTEALQELQDKNDLLLEWTPGETSAGLKGKETKSKGIEEWDTRVGTMTNFIDQFEVKVINVNPSIWSDVLKDLKESRFPYQDDEVAVAEDEERNEIKMIGKTDCLQTVWAGIQLIVEQAKKEKLLQDSVERMVEEDYDSEKLSLLKMSDVYERLLSDYKNIKLEIDDGQGKLIIEGPASLLQKINMEILKFFSKIKEETLELPEGVLQVLKSPEGTELIQKRFKDNEITAVVVHGQRKTKNEASIFSANKNHAQEAIKLLESITKESSVYIKDENVQLLNSPKWKSFAASMEQKHLVNISFQSTGKTLWISGIEPDASDCFTKVVEYMESNTILTDFMNLNKGLLRFLFEICSEDVKEIKDNLKDSFLDLKDGQGTDTLIISGTKEGIERGKEKLRILIDKVCEEEIKIMKPGMKKFFKTGQGSKLIKVVETEHNCIVEVEDDLPKQGSSSSRNAIDVLKPQNGECICSYTTKEGKTIAVFKDDLTKHKVDVIVNAANGELQHYGGLAGAVIREGGKEIQDMCNKFIKENGILLEGQVMETGPGQLPCKRIVHAVGPRWNEKASKDRMEGKVTKQEGLLKYAIMNSLERAKNDQVIAIPAVSTGIFRFPSDLCAVILTETALEFFQENPRCVLSEVHFTNHDDATVKVFLAEIKKRFGKESSFNESGRHPNLATERMYETATSYKREAIAKKKHASFLEEEEESVGKRSHNYHEDEAIFTEEGMSIYVKVGNIAQEVADVLVNTTGEKLALLANACARSFLDAAGPCLQKYCDAIAPVIAGNIGITRPGKLNCKHVIHAVCVGWNNGKGEAILRNIVRKCFEEANKLGANSIAIPAIGTGVLNFPSNIVARLSFEEALEFSRKTQDKLALREVRFVVYEKDHSTVKAFKDEMVKRHSTNISTTHLLTPMPSVTRTTFFSNSSFKQRSEKWFEVKVDNLSVHVQSGDITKESTDAIVVISNPELEIERGRGAGAAILKIGGEDIKRECQQHPKIRPGEVCITSAGRLHAKKLIHYVPPLQSLNDQALLIKAVVDCLEIAEKQGMSSVSFPAIGTGKLGVSPDRCAKAMLLGANTFCNQNPDTSFHLMRIIVYQEEMIKNFVLALKEFSGEKSEKEEEKGVGLFRRIGNYLGITQEAKKEKKPGKESLEACKISLHVYCGALHRLTEAKKAIDELVNKNCIKKWIENPVIAHIEEGLLSEIHSIELRFDTKITVEKPICRIVLQGNSEDVVEAITALHVILNKVKDSENERSKIEAIVKNIQWQYYSDAKEEFVTFSKKTNANIESAYNNNKQQVAIQEKGNDLILDFSTMTIKCEDGEKKVKRKDLRRKEKELGLPDYWTTQPKNADGIEETVHLLDLCPNKNAREYFKVCDLFKKTCSYNILNIQRVQNPTQYHNYAVRKQKMEKEKGSDIERLLFHGTSRDSCPSINHKGFNRSFSGKNATKFGNGTYFAVNAEFSARKPYSPADSQGKRYMYLARVLVGEYTKGDPTMLVPPAKDGTKVADTYDTVVDDVSNPTIFVAFYDWQCYPEYLITFQ